MGSSRRGRPNPKAIHRLRQKFGEAIRSEIADTVDTEEEIRDELRYLIEALRAAR